MSVRVKDVLRNITHVVGSLGDKTVHDFDRLASLFRHWTVADTSGKTFSEVLGHFE